MQTVTFGRTGLEVGQLGFGAAPIGYLQTKQEQVAKVIHELLDAGVNVVDTAACYAGSEEAVGRALKDRRDQAVLVTKCGHVAGDLKGEPFSPQLIRQSVDQSLRRLGTDRIDVMLLHSCEQDVLERGEAMGALVKAQQAGKVRYLGYSGDNEPAAYAAGLDDVDVIEMSISITDQANIDTVLPLCQERDLGVLAKRPLANAAWRELTAQPGMYQRYAAEYTRRLAAMQLTPHELGYHGHTDLEWPEIALRFTISHPGVHVAIAGTTSTVNSRANLAAIAKGPLPDDVVATIRAAFGEAQAQTGETWRGET